MTDTAIPVAQTTPPEPMKAPTALNIPPVAEPAQKPADPAKSESETSAAPEAKPEDDADRKKLKAQRYSQLYAENRQFRLEGASKDQEIAKLRQEVDGLRQLPWDQMTPDQQQAAQLKHVIKTDRLETAQAEAEAIKARAMQTTGATIAAKVEDARERIPDMDAALETFLQNPFPDVGIDFVANSEKGAEIMYHLGKNPAEAHRIARLGDPIQQVVELARIEGRLSAAPVRKVSQAPNPPPTLGGSNSPRSKSYEEMGMDEYSAAYKARAKG